jgi:hypothetical protein
MTEVKMTEEVKMPEETIDWCDAIDWCLSPGREWLRRDKKKLNKAIAEYANYPEFNGTHAAYTKKILMECMSDLCDKLASWHKYQDTIWEEKHDDADAA